MTDIIAQAEAALEGVTGGEWTVAVDRQTWGWVEVDGPSFKIGAPTRATDLTLADEVQRKKDARFIAWCRTGVPALLTALRDAEQLVATLEARAEAAEKAKREMALDALAAAGQAQDAYEAQLAAEARVKRLEEALEQLIDHSHNCEKELTEELHHVDFCGESLPLTNARTTLARLKGETHMSDDDLIRRGDALKVVSHGTYTWGEAVAHIAALPAVDIAPMIAAETAQLRADLAAAVEVLEGWSEVAMHCTIADGVCCCGDNMDGHSDPMTCGHSPVDHGVHVAAQLFEKTSDTLARMKGERT